MNQLNNIAYKIEWNEEEHYNLIEDYIWKPTNEIVSSDQLKSVVKKKSKNHEFLKLPVNPQQTSFKYLKLSKKEMTMEEVLDIIDDFYTSRTYKQGHFKIENTLDIENDPNGIVQDVRNKMEKNYDTCWITMLGPVNSFDKIEEITENNFKMYKLVFKTDYII